MSRSRLRSCYDRLFASRLGDTRQPSLDGIQPYTRRLAVETLEDRRLLAVTLNWSGPNNTLNLTESVSGATPTVVISEPTTNSLKIDLGASNVFASDSTASATGLAYENAGSPGTSHYATIDISAAGNVSSLLAALAGDGLTLGAIQNLAGGIGSVSVSAATIEVVGISTLSTNGNVDLRATGSLTIDASATLQTGTGTLSLAADVNADGSGNDGTGTLSIGAGATVTSSNTTASAITLRGADIDIDTSASPAVIGGQSIGTPTAGGVVLRSSQSSREISLGGTNNAVFGINLTDAELAQIQTTASGTVTIGDNTQTGDITFTTATLATTAGASTVVVQAASGAGKIILDDASGTGTALNGNGGTISLTAGTGGIVASNANNAAAEIATTGATVTLKTTGPIGTSANRIQLADNTNTAQQNVVIGLSSSTNEPSSVYLDGLGSLTLGAIYGGTVNTLIDVTARANLVVAAGATINSGSRTSSLGADLKADGTGDDGTGTLSFLAGSAVYGAGTTLRGADVAIDSTANVGSAQTTSVSVSTLAGSAGQSGSANGTGTAARFNSPTDVAVDSAGNVYVADWSNNVIRKITPTGEVTTLAGTAGQSGSTDGTGSAARFNYPTAVAVDSAGNVYVADSGNNVIRKITPTGEVTTLAGTAGQSGSTNGTGGAARFDYPTDVAVDGAGNVYVSDWNNSEIRKITPSGVVTTLAGTAGQSGSTDGTGSAARFKWPSGLTVDSAGNVYVADSGNNVIRKITPTGEVTTVAGTAGQTGSTDGSGSAARFNTPSDVAVDSLGNLYVTDWGNNVIRKITLAGVVTTLAGTAGQSGSTDGLSTAARFNDPTGIAVDSVGNLYVADKSNHEIRKIDATSDTNLVVIRSSLSSRPVSVGGGDSDVPGINLTDAELARIQTISTGTVLIGDSSQTGDITFTTATVATTAGASTMVIQATSGAGKIILDDAGTGTSLNGNGGVIVTTSGTGGIATAKSSAAGVSLASKGFNATGLTLTPTLSFAPTVGTELTLINNTSSNSITGVFTNLATGSTYTIQYLATTYFFHVNYQGGDGNDLVLTAIETTIRDNAGGTQQGTWTTTTGQGGYGGDFASHAAQGSSNPDQLQWSFTVTPGETYQVSVTWVSATDRATNTPFLLSNGSTVTKLVYVNQKVSPNDFQDQGAWWENLGLVTVTGTTLTVVVTANANGIVVADAVRITPATLTWSMVGVGDFNGDGKSDQVWRRSDDVGEARIVLLNGGTVLDERSLPMMSEGWKIVGIGDFNGDGKSDLAWRRSNDTGEVRIWELNGGAVLADISLPTISTGWKVVGIGDFNGDGKSDLVWRQSDDTGAPQIWELDGTSVPIAYLTNLPAVPSTWKIVGIGDFNGDGKSDLAWRRSDDNGEVRIWLLNGNSILSDTGLPVIPSTWKIVGIGDFNGDGKSDLVWRRSNDTGEARIWTMNGGSLAADMGLTSIDSTWKVVGVGDFNGDGKSDLVWRRTDDTLEARIWEINTGSVLADLSLPAELWTWKLVGVGDFNGDGKSDQVWRRSDDTGEARIVLLDGGTVLADLSLLAVPSAWKIVGIGDFNGDGKSDLVWRRSDDSGEARIWELNGASVLADLGLTAMTSAWKVAGIGDFNDDGKSDVLWRRSNDTGETRIWLLNGNTILDDSSLPTVSTAWKLVGLGDFNGDGKSDLVWRRSDDNGEARIWQMNGSSILSDSGLPVVPSTWKIVGIGDFNGDGKSDLVWRRSNDTGEARIWTINSGSLATDTGLTSIASGWKIVGVGDFNGDGKSDLVWRRTSDLLEPRIWEIDGGSLLADIGLPW